MNHISPATRSDDPRPAPRPLAAPAHQSGFILLIVLGILILITILSVTYLRTMQQRTELVGRTPGQNIGQAANSVMDLALNAIASDMPLKGSGQENHDFPWTDSSVERMPAMLSYPVRQAGLFTKGNSARDDAWLASSYPDDGSNWNHLTNLTGSFLNVNTSVLSISASYPNPVPSPLVPSDARSNNMETNVALSDPRLADADGDGIGDSFLFYPPKSLIGNTRYVAAAYIEDLSAKINLNTALPLRTKSGSIYVYAATAPKAWTPADVDLACLSSLFGATNAEVASAVKWRALGDTTAQPWTDGKRRQYWGSRASKSTLSGEPAAGDTNRYTLADEIELRFHGGVSDHRATTGASGAAVPVRTPVEAPGSGYPTLLRATSATTITETSYTTSPFNTQKTFLRDNPRRWVTTLSGDGARQVGLDGPFMAEELRYNLNIQNPAHFAATVGDTLLPKFFAGPDGAPNTADDYPMPVGLQRFVPTASERNAAMAGQWLANLTDAKDKDNIITRVPDGAGWWFGFEPLPLLSEVYMQRGYYNKLFSGGILTCCASNTGAASGGDTASYAIELANPYQYPIKLTHVDLVIQTAAGAAASGAPYAISTALGTAAAPLNDWATFDNDGDPVLPAGHRLILWKNGSSANANNNISAQVPNTGVNHAVPCGMVITDAAGAGLARVDLLCYSALKDGSGRQRENGAYSTITLPWLPNSFQERTTDAAPPAAPAGFLGFRQVNGRAVGLSAGINLLQCRPALTTGPVLPDLTANNTNVTLTGSGFGDTAIKFSRVRSTAVSGYTATYHALGTDTGKAALAGTRANLNAEKFWFNQQTLTGQPRVAGDQFASLMDLLRVPMLGMRGSSATHRGSLLAEETTVASALYELLGNTATAGDANGGKNALASLCLAIDAGSTKYDGNLAPTSHRNVPFAWLLPCLCDTLNPASDSGLDVDSNGTKDWFDHSGNGKGLDANGNGIQDWPGEVDTGNYLIPGRLNLNTAPLHVLAEALPITNTSLRTSVADKIVTRRNGLATAGTRAATDRGLSSVFEVLQDAGSMSGFSGSAASRYDLVENLGCLPAVATCRSDFFAVHILVQGYPANNFAAGATEQKRVLVLVNRAPLSSPSKAQLKYWVYDY